MRKYSLAVVLFLALTFLLSACSNSTVTEDTPNTEPVAPASEESSSSSTVELRVFGQEYPYSSVALDEFQRRNPDIDLYVEFSNLTVEDGTLQAALRSGDAGPDIVLMSSGPARVGMLAQEGLLRQIDDLLEENDVLSRYQDWIIDQVKAQDTEGRVYELVEGVDVFQIYYNKLAFETAGITKIPETWDEFLECCKKLQDAGIKPITAGFNGGLGAGWLTGQLLESSAGMERISDIIYNGGSFQDPQVVLGGEMLRELVDIGYIDGKEALALDFRQAIQPLYTAKAGMMAIPQNTLLSAASSGEANLDEYGAFPVPSRESGRPSRPAAGLATSWVVNSAISPEKLTAVTKFLEFVSSQDYLEIALSNGGVIIPVLKDIPDVEYSPIMQDASDKLVNGAGFNLSVYLPTKAKNEWYDVLQSIAGKDITPAEAMQRLDNAMKE